MAMNKYMHPRNPYKQAPNFTQLTLDYPNLRKYVKPDLSGKAKINFKCEGAVRELTRCLLDKDFGLRLDLPGDRLVPTLPLRMNYLLWIEDLLNEPHKRLHGVDIGTGASCIYPLLASKHFNWKMTATEVDPESIRYAVANVSNNGLTNVISVKEVEESVVLRGALDEGVCYDFCMCNPPFFCDEAEMRSRARTERRAPPSNHHTGRNSELIAPGGETAFVSRIVADSVALRTRIRVYTVMLGHKSNLNKVKQMVKEVNPVKMRTTEFCQGRTTRWGLAWTFCNDSHLISTAVQLRKNQSKPPYRWIYPGEEDFTTVKSRVIRILKDLHISVSVIENEEDNCGLCLKAYENTWSHSRRRRREERMTLVEKQVASPTDSVVTAGSSVCSNVGPSSPVSMSSNGPTVPLSPASVGSHGQDSPSSPADSLGYSSLEDDRACRETIPSSPASAPSQQSNPTQGDKNSDTLFDNSINISSVAVKSSLSLEHSKELSLCCEKSEVSDNKVTPSCTVVNKSKDSVAKKRKVEGSGCSESKRVKRCSRPLLEAALALSHFQTDIVFSLSFIDGVGGRDAANQVFQHLKNKLTS